MERSDLLKDLSATAEQIGLGKGISMRVIVVTSDNATWRNVSHTLRGIGIQSSRCSSVEDCRDILRRDAVDLVFCDELVSDGDYWDVFSAITRGLIKGPRTILMSRTMTATECEQAKCCGIFAVIESPCPPEAVESSLTLAKRAQRLAPAGAASEEVPKFDIFSGASDRDATWVCSVRGLANAKERMDEIAVERPGRYFIFNAVERTVLAQTETFAQRARLSKARGESA
ncbi:MAG TPA: hypothetical protein VIY69_16260 [Candidatus Acidoferrales bacterium]